MTLAGLVKERDEYLQEFHNRLEDLESIRSGLYDVMESFDNKIYSLANSADLYPHLFDDLEQIKKLLQEHYDQPALLIRSIDTLQHLLRKYMGY